ncbi:MAG TPA: response regulator [Verrucomicrobiae bacterium]|nr:response regulator [Verrucomicrobiae bacterium]
MTDAANNQARKRTRVLIADDSAAIRSSLSALISRLPQVEIAGVAITGSEALQMARSLKPDIVTLDVRMPEMSGIQVLEALQKERLNPVVIMLTGMTETEYQRKCLELGAKYFFHKTTEFEKVIEILLEHNQQLNQTSLSEN